MRKIEVRVERAGKVICKGKVDAADEHEALAILLEDGLPKKVKVQAEAMYLLRAGRAWDMVCGSEFLRPTRQEEYDAMVDTLVPKALPAVMLNQLPEGVQKRMTQWWVIQGGKTKWPAYFNVKKCPQTGCAILYSVEKNFEYRTEVIWGSEPWCGKAAPATVVKVELKSPGMTWVLFDECPKRLKQKVIDAATDQQFLLPGLIKRQTWVRLESEDRGTYPMTLVRVKDDAFPMKVLEFTLKGEPKGWTT